MKIQMHSTTKIVELNGVPARIWEGVTEGGVECHVYVTRVAVHKDDDASEFKKELQEHAPPSINVQAIPLRLII